jgi:pyruvate/2-oxoglutarate dehydrogenase complex dihydrolipoamide dehydrogenase (E3) component
MNQPNNRTKPDRTYDVLVIGGGPAGENAADIAARNGLRVAVIEHELLGGECTYWACMPSKALLRPGEALDALRRVPGAAAAAAGEIDVNEALARRDALASHWDDAGQVSWLENAGVDLLRGHGRIAGERRVEVERADGSMGTYEARRAVVVATGSSASLPRIDGLAEAGIWDSREVTTAKHIPRRLLVIGGGVVGSEMAQAWRWLGADEVTLIELTGHLLPREERFAGEELKASVSRMGIVVHTSASTRSVNREGTDGPATVTVELADGQVVVIETDEVLVATGRKPNTGDLGLESIGLEPGDPIAVDDHLPPDPHRQVPGTHRRGSHRRRRHPRLGRHQSHPQSGLHQP